MTRGHVTSHYFQHVDAGGLELRGIRCRAAQVVNCLRTMQHLAELTAELRPLGLSSMVDQHVLYPGQRRTQLVNALLTRLLGGLNPDAIHIAGDDQLQGMAEDERFAAKCTHTLKLLGVAATPEQLRGCSGQQENDTAPLLQMAKLLRVMESRSGASNAACSSQQHARQGHPDQEASQQSNQQHTGDAAGGVSRTTLLLAAASAQLSKLLSDSTHLFPSDMNDALKLCSDQGVLVQLPMLCQQVVQRAQHLQGTLQQLLGAGGSSCEGAGSTQWQELMQQVDEALCRQLQGMQAFDALYQQELSVWAAAEPTQQAQPAQQAPDQQGSWASALRPASRQCSAGASAEATGRMARSLMSGYQELRGIMEAVGTIMQEHQALQDVPVAELQKQRGQRTTQTCTMRMYASAVR